MIAAARPQSKQYAFALSDEVDSSACPYYLSSDENETRHGSYKSVKIVDIIYIIYLIEFLNVF